MPNPDYDPSLYTDMPVELDSSPNDVQSNAPVETQQNNDPHNISAPVPTPTPVVTDNNNNISNNNTPINVNEDSRCIGQSPSKISSVLHLNSFSNKARRRFFWYVSESEKNNYRSYKDFKRHWNPDTKIYTEIKRDISADLDKLKLNKKTLSWFFNVRNRPRYR